MARFSSPEWIAELDRAVRADEGLRRTGAGVALVVQQTVTDGPDGDATWHLVVHHGDARVVPGAADQADVTFRQSYGTAAAIARGEMSAQTAFMIGELRVGGDVEVLMTHQATFAGVEDVFASVRAGTEY